MLSKKYAVLNLLLCLLIALLVLENYEIWNVSAGWSPHTGILPNQSETINEIPPKLDSPAETAPIQSYNLISGKNIFNPERKEFLGPPNAMAGAPKPVAPPQIVLYGVAIAGDYQSATIANPGRTLRKGEGEAQVVKIGEQVGGYKLAKILPDRITVESEGQTFEVLLYDSRNAKKRVGVRTENKRALIASVQPVATSPPEETPKTASSQESVEKSKGPVQIRMASLPFNKYAYQFLGPSARSAIINRGTIIYPVLASTVQ